MNKFLDFYLDNNFIDLDLITILDKWSNLLYGQLNYKQFDFIISNKQSDDFTNLFFPLDIIKSKYKAIKDGVSIDIKLSNKIVVRRRKDKINKIYLVLPEDLTSYKYEYKCDSCNNLVSGQLKDFYYTIRSNNFVCKKCKNTVSHRLNKYKIKYKKSNIDKYGTAHPVQSKKVRSKIEQTCKERYGYSTPFGSPDLRQIAYETMLKKYGVRGISGFSGGKKISLLENNFIKNFLLKYNNINDDIYCDQLNKQYFIDTENGRKWLDFYIKNKRVAIQVHGDFWHSNLNVFESNKIHPIFKKTFKKVYEESNNNDVILSNNSKIDAYFVVWESSIKKDEVKIINKIIEAIQEGKNGFITL